MSGEKLSDLLLIFRTVVDGESFSAAGRKLNMSPAWVAKQVTRLEAQLEATLLIRSTRSLRLTDAGRECYRTAGIVSEELATLKDKVHAKSNQVSGTVRVNIPTIVALDILAPQLAAFQLKHPNLKLDIIVSDTFTDVLNDEVDVVFRVVESLNDSTIIAQKIGDVARVLCASKQYMDASPPLETLQDLRNHKALMFSGLVNPSSWNLRLEGSEEQITPFFSLQANNSFVLKRAAIDGAGIAFLPRVIVEAELRSGQLVHLEKFEDATPFSLYLLRAPQKYLSNRILAVWHYFTGNANIV